MSDQAILGAVVATASVITGMVIAIAEALHAGELRRRRDLEHRAARYERRSLRVARLACDCADWGYPMLQATNNRLYRVWACRARQVEAELRAMRMK